MKPFTFSLSGDKALIVRLSKDLHKGFKVKCAQEGQNMNAVLTALIEGYVKETKPKKQK
jgi:predicted HicB family RNase H-like nuclease